jgi:hypothetical protein
MYDDYSLKVLAEGPYHEMRPAQLDRITLPLDYPPIFDDFTEEASDTTWISTKRPEERQLQTQFNDKDFFVYAFRATLDGTQIEKDIRFLYRRDEKSKWYMGFDARFRNQLLQSAIVPAFRDPGGQLRATHYSWYGKLMKHLTEKHADRDRLDEAFKEVKNVADEVFEEMREEVAHSVLDVAFPDSELHFQFNSDAGPDLYKNTEIYVDDGVKSKLTEKGSGIQSATIIGLFNYYTDNVNTISSALLCIEEPELYLHPHARRVISKRLDDFLESGDSPNQVILTTHSVDFIRTARRDLRVTLVRKRDDAGTKAQTVPISNFKKLIIDNNQNELFFADKVILCEGYDKYVIEAVADDLFEGALDKENVSVVNVGGKDRLCELAELVTDLDIDCYVMADFDFLLRDKLDERNEYGAKAHDSVLNLGDSFFCQDCLYGDNGTKMKGKLAKFRDDLKDADPKSFYTASQVSDVEDEEHLELLNKHLPPLRKSGLGILSSEIEDFFSDKTLLNGGKLDLEAVYSMNDRRAEGATVGDFLDPEEIRDFLNAVLDQDPTEKTDPTPASPTAG